VFQGYNLLSRTSALENVELPLIYRGGLRRRAESARPRGLGDGRFEGVGIPFARRTLGKDSSRGLRSPAPSSRGLRFLLADEPTGNLDTARSKEIMDLLTTLNRDRGITVIMVTPELDMAAYATRIIRFMDGLVASDQPNGGKPL